MILKTYFLLLLACLEACVIRSYVVLNEPSFCCLLKLFSQNHRIYRVGRESRDHPVQLPCQAVLPGAGETGTIHVGCEHLQRRRTPQPSWAALPVLCCPQQKEALHPIEVELSVF